MISAKRIPITFLVAMIFLGGNGAALAASDFTDDTDQKTLSTILNAKTSIVQAIGIVEKHAGGKVFQVEVRQYSGAVFYEVRSVKNGNVSFSTVDPAHGVVVKSETEGQYEQPFDDGNVGELGKFADASVSLVQLIKTAEKHLGGVAVAAEFEERDENEDNGVPLVAKVKVVKEHILKAVLVDVLTNAVVTVRDEAE